MYRESPTQSTDGSAARFKGLWKLGEVDLEKRVCPVEFVADVSGSFFLQEKNRTVKKSTMTRAIFIGFI